MLKISPVKIVLFLVSLVAFVLALTLMQAGARTVGPLLQKVVDLQGVPQGLGLGWLSAYLFMSGSPVAAASLTLLESDAINSVGAFAMIIGSRLGAAFVVIVIGFLYVLRGRDRAKSLGMGVLSLVVTVTTYIPAFFLGLLLFRLELLGGAVLPDGMVPQAVISAVFNPVVDLMLGLLPRGIVFLAGVGLVIASLQLFDLALPQFENGDRNSSRLLRLADRPAILFVVGAAVTLVSLSVSISLSILVPLSGHRLVRTEQVVPYIMGANITTLIDTLFAAMLVQTPDAMPVVLTAMVAILIVSTLILIIAYRPYERAMVGTARWVTSGRRQLATFLLVALLFPALLLFL